ncbi:type I-F CRISPR-associated helicase Cas3 [Pusillimonas sp. CC-YST705]|uniref:Type I-F CRISPR-associated helicase Cas3 n=1 Tax=Mesopusillimonas faecipullorum TaxID=2755040 RepID=A0ABS8CA01_9BURK|nr:type I-F CRISPR-associated helicase Cas3f [Mesopusillimonas faecipullorum]MCB5362672.1 type I-F CRISPR-associated helicase Cas3 [Mesopusillimonas faecipullorum]
MNVMFVSQCSKRALSETRRILDQFAERRGDRTWQTPITQAGLDTVRTLLRKTARKNTAVACHWIRGLDHSELLWVVGNASQFNALGAVPTNTTSRDILRSQDENDWHSGEDIRLLASIAALMHDLGKASIAFQERLKGKLTERNLYRHEWVSLRLFLAFVGQDDDLGWLKRLSNPDAYDEALWLGKGRYQRDGIDASNNRPFRGLPPVASAIAWLVVSHHRLPVIPVFNEDGLQEWLGKHYGSSVTAWLEAPLLQMMHDSNEIRQEAEPQQIAAYWDPAGALPVSTPKWRAQAARLAKRLLERTSEHPRAWLSNPYAMHLSRLCLMLADHYYSSLPSKAAERVKGEASPQLFANTDRDGKLKQGLDEHLLGVARDASLIAHALPGFERYLPRLARHRGLRKRSGHPRFSWQDKAADAAVALRHAAQERGAFIINMASTGCGKTLANARILYALADPQQGLRASYALGLRTLTLQTGRSYRNDLHLSNDELAILVGGSANRALFEFYEQQAERQGSASIQALIEEDSHVLYEGSTADHPLLARALHDPDIRRLISAPILVCTVDHLTPATESLRAGRQIAPMLRLMSSDLVLDELDDYSLEDLPALTRLVHWAGMLGTRVILSSATLPPALVEGMFLAYQAGRRQYQLNRGRVCTEAQSSLAIPCLWADEYGVHTSDCNDENAFRGKHLAFVEKRAKHLLKAAPLRKGELLTLPLGKNLDPAILHACFSDHVREACLRLHEHHSEPDPISGKRISFGLVRMANVDPLFDVALSLFQKGIPSDVSEQTRIHLCVYHARFPMLYRSAIEHQLDTALNRRDPQAVFYLPDIRAHIDSHAEKNHIFIVLASPVCEVGRDWDADWAVAEPSSMRALIQLAGRVQRHRSKQSENPNVLIFDTNLKHFRPFKGSPDKTPACFVRPGFEKEGAPLTCPFRLLTHRLGKLMRPTEHDNISSLPRIQTAENTLQSQRYLSDLEHARMQDAMLPRELVKAGRNLNAASAWLYPQAALSGVLPQQQPFRANSMKTESLVFLPDEDSGELRVHRIEPDKSRRGKDIYISDHHRLHTLPLLCGPAISPWGKFDLMDLLEEQAEHLGLSLEDCAKRFATVEVPQSIQGWRYHPWMGLASKR